MIAMYGMNKKVGAFSFKDLQNEYAIKQPFSEKTSQLIDEEARVLIDFCYQKSKEILEKHIDDLHTIANELQKKEVLFNNDFVRILGERNTNLST
jgi:cell division protease FtsH